MLKTLEFFDNDPQKLFKCDDDENVGNKEEYKMSHQ